jgi:hypothetical protein
MTKAKARKEARRAERRSSASEALTHIQFRSVLLIQMYFRMMFLIVPHSIYEHLQCLLKEVRHNDMGFTHVSYHRIKRSNKNKVELRCDGLVWKSTLVDTSHGLQPVRREGAIFSVSEDDLKKYMDRMKTDRECTFLQWKLCVSPYSPRTITTVLITYDRVRDGGHCPPHQDWILYIQAADCVHAASGLSYPKLSRGRTAYHFYSKKACMHFSDSLLPDVQ